MPWYFAVNSVCWAPEAYGLMLACGSSDGNVSIISSGGWF
jgi:protein transport protein SEC13